MNNLISLSFDSRYGVLYRISVGRGYLGSFYGVCVSDSLLNLKKFFSGLYFDSSDDVFYFYQMADKSIGDEFSYLDNENEPKDRDNPLYRDEEILFGICFATNYRASLVEAPEQIIEYILVHDWSFHR